jgi:hypothetical protein
VCEKTVLYGSSSVGNGVSQVDGNWQSSVEGVEGGDQCGPRVRHGRHNLRCMSLSAYGRPKEKAC